MITYLPRSAWTRSGPAKAMTPMHQADARGFAVHWPGSKYPIGAPSRESVARRLEGYRRYHVATKGWADIAYQACVDASGRVWDCRGVTWRSAANGSIIDNAQYGALLFLLGPGDEPTDAMVTAVRDWRRTMWLARYPRAVRVVGHADIRDTPTACPGPAAQALVDGGQFLVGRPDSPTPPTWTEVLVRQLPTVRRGDHGENVETVQGLLRARSHPEVTIDGDYGPTTERAVRAVQAWGGVTVDGTVGPRTWAVLLRVHG